MKDKVARSIIKYEAELSENAHRRMQNKLDAIVHYFGIEFYDTSGMPTLICRQIKKVKS